MARKKKDAVSNGPAEPDFAGAAEVIRKEISPDKEDMSKIQGDLSASWKRVEDQFHVNKKAAKSAAQMLTMSQETRDDYLRSLYGMMRAFNISVSADLVDAMQDGETPTMPVRSGASSDSALLN